MTALISVAAVLLALLVGYRIILSSGSSLRPFNPGQAATRMRRPDGGNALLVLAAVNIASLGFEIVEQASAGGRAASTAAGAILPALILIALVALVVTRSLADLILGLLGGGAALTAAYLEHGAAGLIAVLVLTVMVLFLLGFLRGVLRPRR